MADDDLTLEQLADYLHLPSQKVLKLVERGRIPGRKVGGLWRFSRAEIHAWLEARIGLADEDELAEMELAMSSAAGAAAQDWSFSELFSPQATAVPLQARTKDSVIRAMVELATKTGWLWDPDRMLRAVIQREELCPTALDVGAALLHPRRPMSTILERPFIALGITSTGIPFGTSRSGLTDVFFLICSVDDRQHLRTLARLGRLLNTSGFLRALRAASSPDEALAVIAEFDAAIQ